MLCSVAVASAATVGTEFPDYAPGDTVLITGSGWDAGETVTLSLKEDPDMCPDREFSAVADDNGDIRNTDFVVDQHDVGVTFTLTASGGTSGLTAEATFTDNCSAGQVADASCPLTDPSSCKLGCRWISGALTGTCGTTTAAATNGTVCRPASDLCDAVETCNGFSQSCPADGVRSMSTICRRVAGPCDQVEFCNGETKDCPADTFLPDTNTCRPSSALCDAPEKCSGTSADCPADQLRPAGFVCRGSQGPCDAPETCTGSDPQCPVDMPSPSGTVCRGSAGDCDVVEKCDGSTIKCPADAYKPSTTICRPAAGECDLKEYCTGSSPTCPTDMIKGKDTPCTADTNPCTKDACNGVDTSCHHSTGSCSVVTNSALCTYDVDPGTPGDQFRLIFTPDTASSWKLNASNPGQFFYNVIYSGPGNTTVNLVLPYPFVTQGATPVHVYADVMTAVASGIMCFQPGTEVANATNQVTLASYTPQALGSTTTVPVTLPSLPGGLAYINIHLDYGLKKTINYSKNAANDAIDATTMAIKIAEKQSYVFSDSTPGTDTTQSENTFKRDPGIAGMVQRIGSTDPVPNVTAQIYDSSNKLMATVTTDADGWYMWQYKYSGKATTFTVKLPSYNMSQAVTLKSNAMVYVNFIVP